MIDYIIYIILVTIIILIVKISKLIKSLRDNLGIILSLKDIILKKNVNDATKERIILDLCSELLKKSIFQILIFLTLVIIYSILIYFRPEIEIIFFSFRGFIIGIIVSLIFFKFLKNEKL